MKAYSPTGQAVSGSIVHRKLVLALTLLLCCLLQACTFSKGIRVEADSTEADADFALLKTYRWDFSALGKLQPQGGHLEEFDRVLCAQVDKQLAEKGYRRVDTGPVDFTLDYRVVITSEEAALGENPPSTSSADQANQYGLRWSFDKDSTPEFRGLQAPQDRTVVYRHGQLHLGAFAGGQLVWHHTATRILKEQGSNEAERRAALRVAVDKLMAHFPATGQ